MYFLIALVILIAFFLLRNPVENAVGWVLSTFAAIPEEFSKHVVSTFIRLAILNWYTFLMVFLLWDFFSKQMQARAYQFLPCQSEALYAQLPIRLPPGFVCFPFPDEFIYIDTALIYFLKKEMYYCKASNRTLNISQPYKTKSLFVESTISNSI